MLDPLEKLGLLMGSYIHCECIPYEIPDPWATVTDNDSIMCHHNQVRAELDINEHNVLTKVALVLKNDILPFRCYIRSEPYGFHLVSFQEYLRKEPYMWDQPLCAFYAGDNKTVCGLTSMYNTETYEWTAAMDECLWYDVYEEHPKWVCWNCESKLGVFTSKYPVETSNVTIPSYSDNIYTKNYFVQAEAAAKGGIVSASHFTDIVNKHTICDYKLLITPYPSSISYKDVSDV